MDSAEDSEEISEVIVNEFGVLFADLAECVTKRVGLFIRYYMLNVVHLYL